MPSSDVHFLEHAITLPLRWSEQYIYCWNSEMRSAGWRFPTVSVRHNRIRTTPRLCLCNVIVDLLILSNTLSKIHMCGSLPWLPGIWHVYFVIGHTMARFTAPTEKNLELPRNHPIVTHLMWSAVYHGLNYILLKIHITQWNQRPYICFWGQKNRHSRKIKIFKL